MTFHVYGVDGEDFGETTISLFGWLSRIFNCNKKEKRT